MFVFDGPGGHHPGDAAAGTDQHGDKAPARKAETPEYPVQDKGDPGHVTAGFQGGQEDKEDQHLGNKAQHRPHPGDDPVQDEAVEPARGPGGFQPAPHHHRDPRQPKAKVFRGGFFRKPAGFKGFHRLRKGAAPG